MLGCRGLNIKFRRFIVFCVILIFVVVTFPVGGVAADQQVMANGVVNVREGPGLNYPVLAKLKPDQKVTVLSSVNDWHRIDFDGGRIGWVASWTVRKAGSAGGSSATAGAVTTVSGQTAVVKAGSVYLRSGPGTNHSRVGEARKGESMAVLGSSGDWYKVRLSNGKIAWVAGWLVAVQKVSSPEKTGFQVGAASSASKVAVVKEDNINVRGGPGTSHQVIGRANAGDKFSLVDQSGDWYKVLLPSGRLAWIAGWLVSVQNVTTAQPYQPDREAENSGKVVAPSGTGVRKVIVIGSQVNIRGRASDEGEVLTVVDTGDRLSAHGESNGWYKVVLPDGREGWIAGWLVKAEEVSRSGGDSSSPGSSNNNNVIPPQGSQPTKADNVSDRSSNGKTPLIGPGDVIKQVRGEVGATVIPADGSEPYVVGLPEDTREDNSPSKETLKAGARLVEINAREEDNVTKVEMKTDTEVRFSMVNLINPERLIVDLRGVRPGDIPSEIPVGSQAVWQVRVGWFSRDPDVTRVVFDLKGRVFHKAEVSGDKTKLTINIYIPKMDGVLSGRTIVIDPGHGGSDPGAKYWGLEEKDVNLAVAKRVSSILSARGANVVLTRSDDRSVNLYDRTDMANRIGASIFVSVHMNANPSGSMSGTSTYYVRNVPAGEEARQGASRELASKIQNRVLETLGRRNLGVLQANFAVLRTSYMPAALVEVAFLSNREEASMMYGEWFKQQAALGIAEGITDYFGY